METPEGLTCLPSEKIVYLDPEAFECKLSEKEISLFLERGRSFSRDDSPLQDPQGTPLRGDAPPGETEALEQMKIK